MQKHAIPKLTKKKSAFSFGRALIYLGIALLLLIPSYLAVATYIAKKNTPVVDIHTTYEDLALVGPKEQAQAAAAEENTLLFSIFTTLCQDGDEMVAIPPRFLDGHYVATLSSKDTVDTYDFYFFREESTCYYTTPEGDIFRSNHALVSDFLNSAFAFELYNASTLPVLSTAATDEVLPTVVSWRYRTANGTFVERIHNETTDDLRVYPIANDIAFYFSLPPSSHEILIYRNETLLYSGTSQGISLPLQDGEILDFEIRAAFAHSSEQDYSGELVYRFKMQVVEAAHFVPDKTTLYAGDVLVLRCENVKNVEKLVVSATPALDSEAVIFSRGDYVYAAIPFTTTTAHRLKVNYGTVADSFDITVLSHPGTAHALAPDTLHGNWSTLISDTLPSFIATKGAQKDSGLTPRMLSALPDEKIFGYGDTVSINGTPVSASPLSFHLYRASGAVRTLAAGRVNFVGNDPLLGNYVIVDHGCGLYTWYAGLSEPHVVAGDILAVGDTVGLSSTALYHEESVLIMATLGKSAISLEQLCDTPAMLPE